MQEQQTEVVAESSPPTNLARDIALYTVVRLAMLLVVTAVIALCGVPLLVAAAVSVVVVMPLSMLVFGGLRRRVATGMVHRARRREQLRAQLRGDREHADDEH
ncbi:MULTISPECIES: DUF4229 domain-containing protein [unclassified Saccharopolyspora]|uniref:DUF4229 domain-containing protein n=1 Tax=unclassified Saccharopolyspora TaxID=2646250 RepID=UPI001CD627CF|nr:MULTISPECIES: DUF4229 domain-containing protein [unclassified Saccharopolyspora]MCA1187704.1 DUF4229 domain-containing protein [Saccharopolyspora sp. 6T]MCA1191035.1 DUF4229 domain-containing protein [Saccharopolyspora sp. 6V]MCA1225984.1 DUF4229 domain-containing protein [Saccharopolyspora sp. 6M]MCA1278703.1 DUF4229 domain-containing protein [Saccharopolyspora sp. 7B]